MNNSLNESARRTLAGVLQYVGWWGSLSLGLWSVLSYDPQEGRFAPQWVGLGYIFLLGVAIAATQVRSRMRLQAVILKAFELGMTAQQLILQEDLEKERISNIADRATLNRLVKEVMQSDRDSITRRPGEEEA